MQMTEIEPMMWRSQGLNAASSNLGGSLDPQAKRNGNVAQHDYVRRKKCMNEMQEKSPMGLDDMLGHLLVTRIPVMQKPRSTKMPEYLS